MFRRLEHLAVVDFIWGPKVKRGSKVMPKILGFLSRGRVLLSIATWGWTLVCLDQGVKRVMEDFEGAIVSLFSAAHADMGARASLSRAVRVDASSEMSGYESAIVTSSA